MNQPLNREQQLTRALNILIHACQDDIDNYPAIKAACEYAATLIPEHEEEKPFFENYSLVVNQPADFIKLLLENGGCISIINKEPEQIKPGQGISGN